MNRRLYSEKSNDTIQTSVTGWMKWCLARCIFCTSPSTLGMQTYHRGHWLYQLPFAFRSGGLEMQISLVISVPTENPQALLETGTWTLQNCFSFLGSQFVYLLFLQEFFFFFKSVLKKEKSVTIWSYLIWFFKIFQEFKYIFKLLLISHQLGW